MASITWQDFCAHVEKLAKKVNRKAEELTEEAAIRLKLSAKRAELEDEYTALGKRVYEAALAGEDTMPGGATAEALTITELLAEIRSLEETLARRKAKQAQEDTAEQTTEQI